MPTEPTSSDAETSTRHIPVLLAEVCEALAPAAGDILIDGTFGAGGYTSALLAAAPCRVIAIDRDPTAIVAGGAMVAASGGRLMLVEGCFGDLEQIAAEAGGGQPIAGVVLDIGVSSMQLDEAERGFSFMSDGPLDMRMAAAPGHAAPSGPSAADLLATLDADEIADILFHYGEERRSRVIARAIVADRVQTPFTRTGQLASLIERLLGRERDGKHPATRSFQALRIAVNDELGELVRALAAAERVLAPGGRLGVVTFHSLEDRIVKRFFTERTGRGAGGSRHMPEMAPQAAPSFRFVNPRPLTPGNHECARNPRARSAKLRWAVRTEAPPWPLDAGALGLPPVEV